MWSYLLVYSSGSANFLRKHYVGQISLEMVEHSACYSQVYSKKKVPISTILNFVTVFVTIVAMVLLGGRNCWNLYHSWFSSFPSLSIKPLSKFALPLHQCSTVCSTARLLPQWAQTQAPRLLQALTPFWGRCGYVHLVQGRICIIQIFPFRRYPRLGNGFFEMRLCCWQPSFFAWSLPKNWFVVSQWGCCRHCVFDSWRKSLFRVGRFSFDKTAYHRVASPFMVKLASRTRYGSSSATALASNINSRCSRKVWVTKEPRSPRFGEGWVPSHWLLPGILCWFLFFTRWDQLRCIELPSVSSAPFLEESSLPQIVLLPFFPSTPFLPSSFRARTGTGRL